MQTLHDPASIPGSIPVSTVVQRKASSLSVQTEVSSPASLPKEDGRLPVRWLRHIDFQRRDEKACLTGDLASNLHTQVQLEKKSTRHRIKSMK